MHAWEPTGNEDINNNAGAFANQSMANGPCKEDGDQNLNWNKLMQVSNTLVNDGSMVCFTVYLCG